MKKRAELAWLRWYETIPTDVRGLVRRFPSRQWHILSLVARCGSPALDLVVANSALAYALASNWVFHNPPVQRPMRSVRALLRRGRKQRDILVWLGFPGTEAVRRVLTKVAHESISVDGLLYLRQSLVDSKMAKTLSHLQRLNAGAIRIITDRKLFPYASPTLIEEISNMSEEDHHAKAAHELQDSLNMYRIIFPNGKKLQPIRRLAHLRELHDSLIDKLNNSRRSNVDIPLPPPPVEGTETIVPITSIQDLFKEGREQHNCVASYVERMAIQQRTYIYKVLGPERCTLALTQKGNAWVPTEIKKTCNQPVSEVTWSAVGRWLNQASSSVGNNEVPLFEA